VNLNMPIEATPVTKISAFKPNSRVLLSVPELASIEPSRQWVEVTIREALETPDGTRLVRYRIENVPVDQWLVFTTPPEAYELPPRPELTQDDEGSSVAGTPAPDAAMRQLQQLLAQLNR
jgi:hypothetical protein